jgi:hypothetical protein
MLFGFPRRRLLADIAVQNTIVLVLRARGPKRSVVKADETKRFFHVLFKLVQSFQLLRCGGHSIPFGSLEKHLVPGVQRNRDFGVDQYAGPFNPRLTLPLVSDDRGYTVLADFDPAIRKRLGVEPGLPQQLHAFGKGGHLRLLAPEEHNFSIGRANLRACVQA